MARLYDAAAPMVRAVAMRIVRNRHLADEVTQEAFIAVWRTAERFDPDRGSGQSWICTITHRRAVDCVRRESRHDREPVVHSADDRFDPVAETYERSERGSAVRSAIRRLTPKQRQAIGLAYFGSLTQEEVASHLGVPVGTAKSRIRDGMQTMRRMVPAGV
jgi:RNA polymerase sigma-70 factor (ECF subfamily)